MAPTQREFVRLVREHLGLSPTELGEKLGKRNAYGSANSWETENPKNYRKLSYTDTMRMLELCGWLNMAGEAPSTVEPANQVDEIRVAVLTALVQIAHRLEAVLDALGVPEAARGPTQVVREPTPVRSKGTR